MLAVWPGKKPESHPCQIGSVGGWIEGFPCRVMIGIAVGRVQCQRDGSSGVDVKQRGRTTMVVGVVNLRSKSCQVTRFNS